MQVVTVTSATQPELPTRYKKRDDGDGEYDAPIDWPTATRDWWALWGRSPLSDNFTEIDWSELAIAALLHAEVMEGNYKVVGELRLRTAKFGATAEDRLRLRIQFAVATDIEMQAVERAQRVDSRARRAAVRPRVPAAAEVEA